MKQYEFLFIDADDTLFDYEAAEKNALTKTLQEYKIEITNEIISDYSQINKQLWLDYENNKISQELLKTKRFKLLFKKLEVDINEKDFSQHYLIHLSESSFLMHNADIVCKYLHEKYKIVIITNGISFVQKNRLNRSSIKNYIDFLIISEEAKFSKPNIGIFEYAETITNFKNKDKMIIIGDSLTSDILGGLNYGIDTCWLNNKKSINTKNIIPRYIINNLDELLYVL